MNNITETGLKSSVINDCAIAHDGVTKISNEKAGNIVHRPWSVAAPEFLGMLSGSKFNDATLVAIHKDTKKVLPHRTRRGIGSSGAWVREHQKAGFNIYITANQTAGLKRKKTDIVSGRAVWIDDDVTRAKPRIDWPVPPHMIVETSSGKFHYWWLTSYQPEEFDRAEALMKSMIAAHPGADTGVWDVARLLRMPGTVNLKPGAGGHVARLVHIARHARYRLDQLEAAWPSVGDTSDQHQQFSKAAALETIRTGAPGKHAALRDWAAHGIASGQSAIEVKAELDSLMAAHDDGTARHRERGAEIDRLVASAVVKFAPVPPTAEGFEDVPLEVVAERPNYARDKLGEIKPTLGNVAQALRHPGECGVGIAYDEFLGTVMVQENGQGHRLEDEDLVRLRVRLPAIGFKEVGKEIMRDAMGLVAAEHRFDSAQDWLQRQQWDGVSRVAGFMSAYMNAAPSDYHRAVGLYLFTALAGRVMVPGMKADMVPVLISKQGFGKSSAVSALAPSIELFVEISLKEKSDDLARRMRGRLVAELAELRGLATSESEVIKAFITRTHEDWIPKYAEFGKTYARRLVFIGTTNKDRFLDDDTGHRRWLPVHVGVVDVGAIRRDVSQLWAEGRNLFEQHGVMWQQAEHLAANQHADHELGDAWEAPVARWLSGADQYITMPILRPYITTRDALVEALEMADRNIKRADEMRMGRVLTRLGWARKKHRLGLQSINVFFLPGYDLFSG